MAMTGTVLAFGGATISPKMLLPNESVTLSRQNEEIASIVYRRDISNEETLRQISQHLSSRVEPTHVDSIEMNARTSDMQTLASFLSLVTGAGIAAIGMYMFSKSSNDSRENV